MTPIDDTKCQYCGERKPTPLKDEIWLTFRDAPREPVCTTCMRRERRRFVIKAAVDGMSTTEIARLMGLKYKMVRRDILACVTLKEESASLPDNVHSLRQISRLRAESIVRRSFSIASDAANTAATRIRALAEARKANAQLNTLLDLPIKREAEPPAEEEEAPRPTGSTRSTIHKHLKIAK